MSTVIKPYSVWKWRESLLTELWMTTLKLFCIIGCVFFIAVFFSVLWAGTWASNHGSSWMDGPIFFTCIFCVVGVFACAAGLGAIQVKGALDETDEPEGKP